MRVFPAPQESQYALKIRSLSVPSCLDIYHKLVEAVRRILTIDHQVYFGIETISKTIGFGCDKLDS
jgi:hypothetical protein